VIDLDNFSVHTSRASRDWVGEHDMWRMPQPPYSPDLASSNFYLFPTVKKKLERTQVADQDQFFKFPKQFWRLSIGKNWIGYSRLRYGGFKK
jgi:hypothetical protein